MGEWVLSAEEASKESCKNEKHTLCQRMFSFSQPSFVRSSDDDVIVGRVKLDVVPEDLVLCLELGELRAKEVDVCVDSLDIGAARFPLVHDFLLLSEDKFQIGNLLLSVVHYRDSCV